MLILLTLQISQVSRSAIRRCRRSGNIISILFGFCRSGSQRFFRVLIESETLEHNNFVVEEGAKGEEKEAGDALPVEGFEAEQTRNDPDAERARRVNRGSLSCRRDLCCRYATHIEESNGDHD